MRIFTLYRSRGHRPHRDHNRTRETMRENGAVQRDGKICEAPTSNVQHISLGHVPNHRRGETDLDHPFTDI